MDVYISSYHAISCAPVQSIDTGPSRDLFPHNIEEPIQPWPTKGELVSVDDMLASLGVYLEPAVLFCNR
jgi:hypothetical protein